jgi:hypothetical protein
MPTKTLQFILFIDDSRAERDWRHHLASNIRLRDLEGEHGNVAEIIANREFDRSKIDDPDEGFLFFPWQLQCSPNVLRTEAQQIELAKRLRSILEAAGCKIVVAANFENKL